MSFGMLMNPRVECDGRVRWEVLLNALKFKDPLTRRVIFIDHFRDNTFLSTLYLHRFYGNRISDAIEVLFYFSLWDQSDVSTKFTTGCPSNHINKQNQNQTLPGCAAELENVSTTRELVT